MDLECREILDNINTNIFYAIAKADGEIVYFKFLKFKSYSKWEEEKFNAEFVKKNVIKEDLQKFYEAIKECGQKGYSEVVFRFATKDNRFIFIKSKLSLVKKDKEYIYCIGTNENVSKEKEYEVIVEKIKSSPHVGYLIFNEKILYANETLKKWVGCDKCEGVSLLEMVKDANEEEYKEVIRRRLRGEDIFFYRENIQLAVNKRIFVNAYVQTIVYEGRYAGLALIVDNTENVKREQFARIINRISEFLANYDNKKEFFGVVYNTIKEMGYECHIKYENIEIGKKNCLKFEKITIFDKGKGVYIPFDKGELVILSSYENEFNEKFNEEYIKLQYTLNYAIESINRNRLLNILKEAIEKSYQWVIISDKNGKIIYANDVVVNISGYSREEIIGRTPKIFKSGFHSVEFYQKLWSTIKNKDIFEDVFIERRKDGSIFYLKLKIVPVEVDDELYFVSLGLDITKEKELQENLLKDEITGLLNRKGFLLYAKDVLNKDSYVLLLIDIRNFKAINQVKGTNYGNYLLEEFANVLRLFFYEDDLIARVGADEFVVLMKLDNSVNLYKVLEKFIHKVKSIENLSVNIGIAVYPKDSNDIVELIEKATIALEAAKKEGENRYEFYDSELQSEIQKLLEAKNLVNDALKNDLFEYFFQPYYSIKEDKIVGAESLIRIIKDQTVLTPYFFIDYAEKSGVIKDIEKLMFTKIPYYLKKLKLPLSINLSAVSIVDKEHLKTIFKFDSNMLTIELTERVIAKNLEETKKLFEELKKRGFKIAIDDFGTGYSSLTYIKELDMDVLKIDMSFIKNLTTSQKDLAVVKTILTLAKTLNLKTIAEGVENIEQLNILKELGCDYIQGYLISPPLALEEFVEFQKNFKGLK